MPGVTKEQIAKAKEWDLLSYLQAYEPQELKRCGPNEYCTVTHDSLKISNGKWCWNSRGIGGRTALDYLIKVRGVSFVSAVETLCGFSAPPAPERRAPPPKEPSKPFVLPEKSWCAINMISYLKNRGIYPEVISECIHQGIVYESKNHNNCVFVGRDPSGRERAASIRGIGNNYKIEVAGSDKHFSFCLPASDANCKSLVVAESPIDALSVASLVKRSGEEWRNCHYLSLGGTGPRAMMQFLHDHPDVTQVSLCLDNDKAGLDGIRRLEQAIRGDEKLAGRIRLIYPNPPPKEFGKDYNELLVKQLLADRAQQRERGAAAR